MTDLSTPLHLLECWLVDLQADRADGTIKRYRGATWRFLCWYQQQEQRALVLADLTPITLVSYRTDLQRAHAPSTVNTHVSALRAWCVWLTEHGYLSENPARRFKLVKRTDPAAPRSLSPQQVHARLASSRKNPPSAARPGPGAALAPDRHAHWRVRGAHLGRHPLWRKAGAGPHCRKAHKFATFDS